MIRQIARQRRFALFAALLGSLLIVGACRTEPVKRNSSAAPKERDRFKSLDSPALTKSEAFWSSAKYQWLQKSIQNTGPQVLPSDYPWQVGLRMQLGQQSWRCGGTLISRSFILTAAHCLDGANAKDMSSTIRIGLSDIAVFHGGSTFGSGTPLALDQSWPVTFHPQWKKTGQAFAWDAALLKLAAPLAVVTAPASSVSFGEGLAVTSGWGDPRMGTGPIGVLRAVAVPVVTNDNCRASLPADQRAAVGPYTLCAVSKVDDACVRDSGGPLVAGGAFQPKTIGIVSWGLAGACGVPGPTGLLVGAYTRVSEIASWIKQTTGDSSAVTDVRPGTTFIVRPRNDM